MPAYAVVQFCFKSSALRSCLSTAKQGGGKTRNNTRQGRDMYYIYFWGEMIFLLFLAAKVSVWRLFPHATSRHWSPFLQVTELVFFRACKMRVERSKSREERANARASERSTHHYYIHFKTELAATISMLKLNFSPVRGSILMQFRLLEPPEFHSTGHWILFKIGCEMYILRQFEIVIICMPFIFGQSMLSFGQK